MISNGRAKIHPQVAAKTRECGIGLKNCDNTACRAMCGAIIPAQSVPPLMLFWQRKDLPSPAYQRVWAALRTALGPDKSATNGLMSPKLSEPSPLMSVLVNGHWG